MFRILCYIILISCAHDTNSKISSYPDYWWQEIPKSELHWWEISPHSAGKGEVILSKRNELGILSNFSHAPFHFDGEYYPNVESFWQSLKYPEGKNDPRYKLGKWPFKREDVKKMDGFAAKSAGDLASKIMKENGINYVTYKGQKMPYRVNVKGEHYSLIRSVMLEKWLQNPKVQEILESTKGLRLLPDHHVGKNDPPAWRYYTIWMEIRDSLPDNLPSSE